MIFTDDIIRNILWSVDQMLTVFDTLYPNGTGIINTNIISNINFDVMVMITRNLTRYLASVQPLLGTLPMNQLNYLLPIMRSTGRTISNVVMLSSNTIESNTLDALSQIDLQVFNHSLELLLNRILEFSGAIVFLF